MLPDKATRGCCTCINENDKQQDLPGLPAVVELMGPIVHLNN